MREIINSIHYGNFKNELLFGAPKIKFAFADLYGQRLGGGPLVRQLLGSRWVLGKGLERCKACANGRITACMVRMDP